MYNICWNLFLIGLGVLGLMTLWGSAPVDVIAIITSIFAILAGIGGLLHI